MIAAVSNPISQLDFAGGVSASKSVSRSEIQTLIPVQASRDAFFTWKNLLDKTWKTVELAPDLFTIIEQSINLIQHSVQQVPTALRVAFASVGTFNFLGVGLLAPDVIHMLQLCRPKVGGSLGAGHVITITYWSTLVATFTALGLLGLKEFCNLFKVSPAYLERMLGLLLPWIGYALRLSAVVQLMDIFWGSRFQKEIDDALSLDTRKPDWVAPKKTFWETLWTAQSASWQYLASEVKDSYDCAVKSLEVIDTRRRYLTRANGFSKGLKKRIVQLKAQLHESKTKHPAAVYAASREAIDLARQLRARSIDRTQNQTYGFGANVCAVLAMLVTNVVSVAVFSILSASYYITQTVHRWHMVPPVTLEPPSKVNVKEVEKTLAAAASITADVAKEII